MGLHEGWDLLAVFPVRVGRILLRLVLGYNNVKGVTCILHYCNCIATCRCPAVHLFTISCVLTLIVKPPYVLPMNLSLSSIFIF